MIRQLADIALWVVAVPVGLVPRRYSAGRSGPLDARELVRELSRKRKPLDLTLALWLDQPEAIHAERVNVDLADAQERTRGARLPCCGLIVHGSRG